MGYEGNTDDFTSDDNICLLELKYLALKEEMNSKVDMLLQMLAEKKENRINSFDAEAGSD